MAARIVLNPGDVFAGYTIEQRLGVGGMGTVYRAQDPDLPRSVALKLLHRDLTADDYIRSRFELEAAHSARLEHPNIVTVYRRGREDDQLWIAMQFVEITDAAVILDQGPIDPARAVHIITETANALDYAHSAGVLHRDVKPANILLERPRPGRPGRVLLADFGIAKALAETAHLTQTGMLVASLQYASPEQFDNIELDARADVYALGCTLFHLLTGQIPYSGTTLPQLWAGHVKAPIPKPSQVRPGLPPALDAVIERAMAKERDDRYPSCGELAAATRAALHAPMVPPLPPRPDLRATQHAPTPRWGMAAPIQERIRIAPPVRPSRPSRPSGAGARASRILAYSGLILLIALICAALVTWRYYGSWYSDYDGQWHDYSGYRPLNLPINTKGYRNATVLFIALAVIGALLLVVAAALGLARRGPAGRIAGIGALGLAFGLFALQLAIRSGLATAAKQQEMQYVALLGAVLLLAGCWRGLTPSLRNAVLLVVSGVVVIVLTVAGHLVRYIWVLSEGYGGWLAGITLTVAGVVLAVRHRLTQART